MRRLLFSVIAILTVLSSCSCTKDSPVPPWPWEDPDPEPEPLKGKKAYVWIDVANFPTFANSRDNIATELAKIKEMGFSDIVVDVRGTCGDVLFKSSYASPMTKTDVWHGSVYKWEYRTETFDYLHAFIDAAKPLGLGVCASINTFVGGKLCPYGLGSTGMLYNDSSKKSWASVVNTSAGLVNTLDTGNPGPQFLSPANDKVQEYVLGIIGDLAKYDLDGIVLDRCRYDDNNLLSDFSDAARAKFEEYKGAPVKLWPNDVMKPGQEGIPSAITEDFKLWMEFKVKVIHDFIVKAADKVHSVNPKMKFGVYVGGWLSDYYYSGVNWSTPNYAITNLSGYKKWATAKYQEYGFADHCDFMFIGAYAGTNGIHGSGEWTMEGFCKKAGDYVCGKTTYYGGPDIGNSSGFEHGGAGAYMPEIVKTIMNASNGGMFVFDLCHIRMFDYWADFKKAFEEYNK